MERVEIVDTVLGFGFRRVDTRLSVTGVVLLSTPVTVSGNPT